MLGLVKPIYAQDLNTKHSFKAWPYHNLSFKDKSAEEFSNSIIRGACYYQEAEYNEDSLSTTPKDPKVDIFPDGMTGVIFDRCNLWNVIVPPGNTVLPNCGIGRIRVQNDWQDWILGTDNKPVEPMDKDKRIEKGISILPEDIPSTLMTQEERDAFEASLNSISP